MSPLLEGQYALVTGGSRGIGWAIAEVLASHGAKVAVTSRHEEESVNVALHLVESYGITARGFGCDVSDAESVSSLFQRLSDWSSGILDVLVNNAGYPMNAKLWNTPLHEVPGGKVGDWFQDVFRTDALGAVYCTREALQLMVPRKSGRIIFVTSTPALEGYQGTPYTLAKAAVLGLMKDVAREYGPFRIRANAMALGNIQTPATIDALNEEARRRLASEAPLGRWGLPEEVGRVALFLASDLSSFVTGQTLVVDGGTLRR